MGMGNGPNPKAQGTVFLAFVFFATRYLNPKLKIRWMIDDWMLNVEESLRTR